MDILEGQTATGFPLQLTNFNKAPLKHCHINHCMAVLLNSLNYKEMKKLIPALVNDNKT
jgi:hypothetical protein